MANEIVVNGIKLTDEGPLIKRDSASVISIRNTGDTDYVDFTAGVITGDTLVASDLLKIVIKPTVTSANDFDLLGRINTGASDGNVVSVALGSGLSINESGELVASNDITVEANGTPLTNRTTYNVLNGLTAVDDGISKTLFKLGGTLTDSNTQIFTNSLGTSFGIRLGQTAVTNNASISLGAAALPNNTGVTIGASDPTNSTFGTFQVFSNGVVRFSNHTNTFFGLDNGGLFIQLDLGSDSTGDVYYRDSGYLKRLGIGSEGQVLTVSSGLPSWQDPTGGGGSVSEEDIQDIVGAFITDSSTIDFTYNDAGNTMSASIVSNSIGNSQFRQAGPLSIIGNPTNVTSNIQDISASSNNQILRRVSNTIGFGTISATSGAFTMSTDRLLGRTTASTGSVELIQVTNGLTLVHPMSLQLGGTLTTNTTITVPSSVSFSVSTASPASSIQVARTVTQSYLKFINMSSTTGEFTISLDIDGASGSAGAIITDTRSTPRGLQYASNYGTTFTARSLADVDYVDSIIWEDVTDTTYTFLESDKTKVKRFTNPSGCLVTIPAGLSVGWNVIIQRGYGAGQVTLTTAQTLEAPANTIDFEGGFVTIFRRATNIYVASGALGSTSGGGGGSGTVTSVDLSNITDFATATGAPIVGAGTLGYTLNSQPQRTFFAGPINDPSGVPTFRTIDILDQPRLVKTVTGSTYTVTADDLGYIIYFAEPTGTTVTLTDSIESTVTGFYFTAIRDKSMTSGDLTFTQSGSAVLNTFNGETSVVVPNGMVSWHLKGVNWYGAGTLGVLASGGGSGGHEIESNGSPITNRTVLNFTNGLTATDTGSEIQVKLGGTLTETTVITGAETLTLDVDDVTINGDNSAVIMYGGGTKRLQFTSTSTLFTIGSDSQGDIHYQNASLQLTRLPIGDPNTLLGANNDGTAPEYKTVSNGLTSGSGTLKLGGALTGNTDITGDFNLTLGTSVSKLNRFVVRSEELTDLVSDTLAGMAISSSAAYINFHATNGPGSTPVSTWNAYGFTFTGSATQAAFHDKRSTPAGIQYSGDYSANYTDRSLVDKGYVLGAKTYTGSQTLRAGTTTSGTAPLYFQNGSLLTTPANGALEFNGTHLYITIGSNRYQLDQQGGIDGSGAAGQVTFWQDSDTITGDAAFVYNASTNILSVDGIQLGISLTSGTTRTVSAVGSEDNIDISISPKANGNVILGVNSTGVVQIGSSSVSGDRTITTGSSSTNANLLIQSKGLGSIYLGSPSGSSDNGFDQGLIVLGHNSSGGAARSIWVNGVSTSISLFFRTKGPDSYYQVRAAKSAEFLSHDTLEGFILDIENHTIQQQNGEGATNPFRIRAAGGVALNNAHASDLHILGGDSSGALSGNLNGGSILIQSGQRRTAGSGTDGNITIDPLTGFLILPNIPTSAAGVPSGGIWSNNGVLTRVA